MPIASFSALVVSLNQLAGYCVPSDVLMQHQLVKVFRLIKMPYLYYLALAYLKGDSKCYINNCSTTTIRSSYFNLKPFDNKSRRKTAFCINKIWTNIIINYIESWSFIVKNIPITSIICSFYDNQSWSKPRKQTCHRLIRCLYMTKLAIPFYFAKTIGNISSSV